MTIGIYLLRFSGTDKVYIGQSLNLETRLTRHICRVTSGTGSKKLTKAFKDYGYPSIEFLITCESFELDSIEAETIDIYDSVNNGFNTAFSMVKCSLFGQDNPNSKYSNEQIEDAFHLLIDTKLKAKEIAAICGISSSMVGHISCGESHKWLNNKHPDKYKILIALKGTR